MPGSEQRADGAAAILQAATALFAREGFEPVSVADIAAEAGVSKANVFYHFASKEALYLAVMRQISDEHAEYAEGLLVAPGGTAERLRSLFVFELRAMIENETRSRLVLREFGECETSRARRLAQKVFERNFRAVVALFEQGRERGEFAPELNPAVAALVWGGAQHVFFQCRDLARGTTEFRAVDSAADYAESVCELLLSGLLTRGKSKKESSKQ